MAHGFFDELQKLSAAADAEVEETEEVKEAEEVEEVKEAEETKEAEEAGTRIVENLFNRFYGESE